MRCNSYGCCKLKETESEKEADLSMEELPCVFGGNFAGGDVGEIGERLGQHKFEGRKGQGGGEHKGGSECWESAETRAWPNRA